MARVRRGSRSGQALIEFALTAPVLLLILFGTIEITRLLNLHVSLDRLVQRTAIELAAADITASRPPTAAVEAMRRELRIPGSDREFNPVYAPLSVAFDAARDPDSVVEVDVNHSQGGRYASRVEMHLRVRPMLLPSLEFGSRSFGTIVISAVGLAVNETQAPRADREGRYRPVRFPVARVLEAPGSSIQVPVTHTPAGPGSALYQPPAPPALPASEEAPPETVPALPEPTVPETKETP